MHTGRARLLLESALLLAAASVVYLVAVWLRIGQELDYLGFEGRKSVDHGSRRGLTAFVELGTPLLLGIGALVIAGLGRRRGGGASAAVLISVASAPIAASLLKATLGRPDTLRFRWVTLSNTFPSGHAAVVIAMAMGILTMVDRSARARMTVVMIVIVAVHTVGVLGSGWHRPSDVAGGLLLGSAFASAVIPVAIRTKVSVSDPQKMALPWYNDCRSVGAVLAVSVSATAAVGLVFRNTPANPDHPFLMLLLTILGVSSLAIMLVVLHVRRCSWWEASMPPASGA